MIVIYVIDVILIAVGLTFKILTDKRMGKTKKRKKKEPETDVRGLRQADKDICSECNYCIVTTGKKKKTSVRYCGYDKAPECVMDVPFVLERETLDEEVNGNE
jgi:hypothetical protein